MKVNGVTKWIMINPHDQASSLLQVMIRADKSSEFTATGRSKWSSLINGSLFYGNCSKEGFSIVDNSGGTNPQQLKARIGIMTCRKEYHDNKCKSCIGFGTSVLVWNGEIRETTCGNIAFCDELDNKSTPAFGYIFVQ